MAFLENIRLRVLALRSSVHNEECLTAVELAGMNAKKTNEIIDVVNEVVEVLENGAFKYDEATESLSIDFGGKNNG